MHNNTYTVVGTSVHNGVCKIRFANGLAKRIAVLKRNGHDENKIMLFECDAMHKLDAAKWLLTQEGINEESLAVITAYVNQNTVAE